MSGSNGGGGGTTTTMETIQPPLSIVDDDDDGYNKPCDPKLSIIVSTTFQQQQQQQQQDGHWLIKRILMPTPKIMATTLVMCVPKSACCCCCHHCYDDRRDDYSVLQCFWWWCGPKMATVIRRTWTIDVVVHCPVIIVIRTLLLNSIPVIVLVVLKSCPTSVLSSAGVSETKTNQNNHNKAQNNDDDNNLGAIVERIPRIPRRRRRRIRSDHTHYHNHTHNNNAHHHHHHNHPRTYHNNHNNNNFDFDFIKLQYLVFIRFWFLLNIIINLNPNYHHLMVLGDRNRFYHISALCLRERVHPLSKKIDGAVITSKAENNLDCTITFQTDTILQKFMLRFEKLALDCNDHLFIYDGAHTIGNHKADLSCRSTRAEVGTIYTQSNFLTLRYTTDAYSKADNGFRLIITAYKDSKNFCREHRCANQYCISKDLVCDGVNHCGDNSDEHYYVHCQESEITDTIIGLDPMMFIAIVSSVFVSCLACVISVAFCLCHRERLIQRQQQQQQQQQQIALQQQYQMHDTGHHLGTTPLMQTAMAHHHHINNNNNNSYATKLVDGACTMITSLDYGTTLATPAMLTRNGGLVNSYTHNALPNNNNNNSNSIMQQNHILANNNTTTNNIGQLTNNPNHFSTLPHQHNHQQQPSPNQIIQPPVLNANTTANNAHHVRFGTLPGRTSSSTNKPSPPPNYPGANHLNGPGAIVQLPPPLAPVPVLPAASASSQMPMVGVVAASTATPITTTSANNNNHGHVVFAQHQHP